MTLSAAKPGGWALNDLLLSTEMTFLQAELLKAVDGAGGGTYTLSAFLRFNSNEVRIGSVARIMSGGSLVADAGSSWTMNSPGTVNAQTDFNGDTDFFGDVDFRVGSVVTFFALQDLNVNAQLITWRIDMTAAHVVESGGANTWLSTGTSPWTQSILSSSAIVSFPLRVMQGDIIETIGISFDAAGGHGGVFPATMPRVRLLESVTGDAGSWTSLFSVDDPVATVPAYEAYHFFLIDNTLSGGVLPYTALNRAYRIEIRGENGGSAVTGLELGMIAGSMTRNQLVSTNII